MNRRRARLLTFVAVTAVAVSLGVPPSLGLSAHAVVPAPLGQRVAGALYDVDAVSASNVWAVGTDGHGLTLVEHWHGDGWARVSSPNPVGAQDSLLFGVSAVSASDVWAVGAYTKTGPGISLVEHWNGRKWSRVPSPSPGGAKGTILYGVSAVSASDVWAVGEYGSRGFVQKSLIEHWDGTTWRQVRSPNPSGPSGTYLGDVSALSATMAWAVGDYFKGGVQKTLVVRWDGTRWRQQSSPNPGGGHGSRLNAVDAVSAADVWAVGGAGGRTLTVRRDGGTWTPIASPSPGQESHLSDIGVRSAHDAWAVGSSDLDTLIEHWDGTSWVTVASLSPGFRNYLGGVTADTATDAWAVGDFFRYHQDWILIEHWNGSAWTRSRPGS